MHHRPPNGGYGERPSRLGLTPLALALPRLIGSLTATTPLLAHRVRGPRMAKNALPGRDLASVSSACHDFETRLDDTQEPMSDEMRAQLVALWRDIMHRLAAFVTTEEPRIEITHAEYDALAHAISRVEPKAELSALVDAWTLEPTELRLTRVAQQVRSISERLGKGSVAIILEPHGHRLAAEKWASFWAAFGHLLRNAIDHGLEAPALREAAGKSKVGTITLRTYVERESFVVSLEDDGGGIDWEAVAEKARAIGLGADTQAEREAVLFEDGVTTREEVTHSSGRGVGLGAFLDEVRQRGGRVELRSVRGQGVRWDAHFPIAQMGGPVRHVRASHTPVGPQTMPRGTLLS